MASVSNLQSLTFALLVAAVAAQPLLFRPRTGLLSSLMNNEESKKPSFCRSLDCPEFEVIEKNENYEVRKYKASFWVSTNAVDISYSTAGYNNFMKLFRYISGNNVASKKIAMTAPVINRIIPGEGPACEDNFTMSFFVAPSQNPAPAPKDAKVFLSSLPEQTVYVKSFGGFATKDKYIQTAASLAEQLPESAKYHTDYWYTAGYDSPFTFLNRHNEVWFIGK